MTLNIRAIDETRPNFAARVDGVNIANGVDAETARQLEDAIDQFGVLVFSDQHVTDCLLYTSPSPRDS